MISASHQRHILLKLLFMKGFGLVLSLVCLLSAAAIADPGAPDTVRFESVTVQPGEHFPVRVSLFNDEELAAATLGFRWGTPDLFLDSVSWIGSKVQNVPAAQQLSTIDNTVNFEALTGFFTILDPPIPASDSLFATLWFTANPNAANQAILVDSAKILPNGDFLLVAILLNEEITPQYQSGTITISCGALGDQDGDQICDNLDNCIAVANPAQSDSDADGVGDACDICPGFDDTLDADSDGVPDGCDICAGFDDGVDTDSDGVPDGCDICPGFNDAQDTDSDGVPDGCDICAGFDDGVDTDADGTPDGCDICAGFNDALDNDSDGLPNGCDNCPDTSNPDQLDSDEDGIGDVCDNCCDTPGDFNNDGSYNIADVTAGIARIFLGGPPPECDIEADANGDTTYSIADVTYGIARIFAGGPAPICVFIGQ